VAGQGRCPSGHEFAGTRRSSCPACRRDEVINHVVARDASLPQEVIVVAVDAVTVTPAALRSLAAALAADPEALRCGAPPVVGRLVTELIARGSALAAPACAACARTGRPLTRTTRGGMCARCAHRAGAAGCVRCHAVKPVAGRTGDGQPICERCRRWERGLRRCGRCGKTAPIAVRARGAGPDVCVNCYKMPEADCSVCGRRRECNFAATTRPVCLSCSPRATATCARCGAARPAQARWPEGPVCDPCYTAALRNRGTCASCGQQRRLVAPPGPDAVTCADCAGIPVTCACVDCGTEDKLYEKGRCARCSLRRRATELLSAGTGLVPPELMGVFGAVTAARQPRSALNWLRSGAGALLLADVAAGRLAIAHQDLDAHPRHRAADYLRHMLVAGGALPARDEPLARANQWLAGILEAIEPAADRRLVHAYATWDVMRRLRARAASSGLARTPTAHARNNVRAAADLLAWLRQQGMTLAECSQSDVDEWLATGPSAAQARYFLAWAAARTHCGKLSVPAPARTTGPAASDDQRWALAARLLRDDALEPTDRVAGCLLLLYGQQLSRIAAMTASQVTRRGSDVLIRLGEHDVPLPGPLGTAVLQLISHGRAHAGVGSPATSPWLFPGHLPGRPITPARLGERLRALGVYAMTGRRAALTSLAAQLPAAVLADLLGITPGTAVRWMHQAGGDWNKYAAHVARNGPHQQ
jgi:hypothetical protein